VSARHETRAGDGAALSLRKAAPEGGGEPASPRGRAARRRRRRNVVAPLAVVFVLLAAWELVVRAGMVDELLLPAPTQVLQALWEDRELLAPDLLVTSYEILAGLAAALMLGVALAVAMHMVPSVETALRPLVVSSQAVPLPVIAPIIVLIFGFGLAPKVLIIALICFFPVTVAVADGLRESDPDARKLLQVLGASKWQRLRLLDAPSALPAAFTGMRVAASIAVIGAVLAEWSGSDSGLGHLLITANGQLETARAFAATVLLMAQAIALYTLFAALERKVVSWAPRSRS
jgi:NitT/TauT family transport system permease protein/putative hydroxymethylpyrimidine transport system permease protein